MAKIIDLSDVKEYRIRELEREIEKGIQRINHPDERVKELWAGMAKETIRKYHGLPPEIVGPKKVELPVAISEEQADGIAQVMRELVEGYKAAFLERQLEMLADIMLLQKEVAEYQVSEHNH